MYGSSKNLSNQGSLKNHLLKEFFKEPIMVSHRTFRGHVDRRRPSEDTLRGGDPQRTR